MSDPTPCDGSGIVWVSTPKFECPGCPACQKAGGAQAGDDMPLVNEPVRRRARELMGTVYRYHVPDGHPGESFPVVALHTVRSIVEMWVAQSGLAGEGDRSPQVADSGGGTPNAEPRDQAGDVAGAETPSPSKAGTPARAAGVTPVAPPDYEWRVTWREGNRPEHLTVEYVNSPWQSSETRETVARQNVASLKRRDYCTEVRLARRRANAWEEVPCDDT